MSPHLTLPAAVFSASGGSIFKPVNLFTGFQKNLLGPHRKKLELLTGASQALPDLASAAVSP